MSNITIDLSAFLSAIDAITTRLEPPRRSQDVGAPDCTSRQLSALHAVSKHGRLNMSELAAIIDVPVSTATRIVDQLVSKNLFKRMSSLEDGRKVEVDFSQLGDDISRYIDKIRQEQALAMLSNVPEKQRAAFLRQLSRLISTTPQK